MPRSKKPKFFIDLPKGTHQWKGITFKVPNTHPHHLEKLVALGYNKVKPIEKPAKPKENKE